MGAATFLAGNGGGIISEESAGLGAGPDEAMPPTGAESSWSTFQKEVIQEAFAMVCYRLELTLDRADPNGVVSDSAPTAPSPQEVRYAFARAHWALLAQLGDHQQSLIALAALSLPRSLLGVRIPDPGLITSLRPSRLQHYIEWLRSAGPAGDWGIVVAAELFSEEERSEALHRILGRMKGPPIYPKRWKANVSAFLAAEEELGHSTDVLAFFRGWEALDDAVKDRSLIDVIEAPRDKQNVMRAFRTTLERLLCDDLLGPDWRKNRPKETELPSDDARPLWSRDVLDKLSPEEQALWKAYRDVGNWRAAGQTLGLKDTDLQMRRKSIVSELKSLPLGPGRHEKGADIDAPGETGEAGAAAAAEPMVDAILDTIETREMVDELLDSARLTGGQRDVIDRDRVGWTTAEIATDLATTATAIRRRRSDAMKKLRAAATSGLAEARET